MTGLTVGARRRRGRGSPQRPPSAGGRGAGAPVLVDPDPGGRASGEPIVGEPIVGNPDDGGRASGVGWCAVWASAVTGWGSCCGRRPASAARTAITTIAAITARTMSTISMPVRTPPTSLPCPATAPHASREPRARRRPHRVVAAPSESPPLPPSRWVRSESLPPPPSRRRSLRVVAADPSHRAGRTARSDSDRTHGLGGRGDDGEAPAVTSDDGDSGDSDVWRRRVAATCGGAQTATGDMRRWGLAPAATPPGGPSPRRASSSTAVTMTTGRRVAAARS